MKRFLIFDDDGPDSLGRRSFTLIWTDPDGIFRPEPSLYDGKPVGFRRGQCFRTKPDRFLKTHKITTLAEAQAAIA